MSEFSLVQKRAIISVLATVGVHVFVLGLWILLIIWDLPIFAYEPPEQDPRPEPEMTVVLLPFVPKPPPVIPLPPPAEPVVKKQQAPPPPPVAPVQPPIPPAEQAKPAAPAPDAEQPKRRFARTSAEQEGTPDEATDVLGERDTRAASELAPTPGAKPNTPAQDGAAPLFPGHVETVDKTYQDGSVGKDKQGEETETPQEASASKDNTTIDDAPKLETPEPDKASSARPNNKHLAEGLKIPVPQEGEGNKMIEDEPKAEDSPRERPDQGANKDGTGDATEQEPKKDGFSGHSEKTRVTGSISRQGKSALNVKNSPLGRYQALVSKAVELQWRRNCEQHRDHIVPGVISIRFYVDKNGGVSGIKFQEVVGANYIERGFTQRALRQAKLPSMPKAVLKELNGDPLELIYNFYF